MRILIAILFFSQVQFSFCQPIAIVDEDTILYWDLLEKQPKGEHWVFRLNNNRQDTFARVEFIEDSISHGVWTKYGSNYFCRQCTEEESCNKSHHFKEEETIYNYGKIIKETLYHPGEDNQPWEEYFYPINSGVEKILYEEKIWSQNGNLWKYLLIHASGLTDFVEYYENQSPKVRGQLKEKNEFHGKWVFFYQNGIIAATGNFDKSEFDMYFRSYGYPIGEWKFWNRSGELLTKVNFQNEKDRRKTLVDYKDLVPKRIIELLMK